MNKRLCLCGCKQLNKGRDYLPGHNAANKHLWVGSVKPGGRIPRGVVTEKYERPNIAPRTDKEVKDPVDGISAATIFAAYRRTNKEQAE